MYRAAKLDPTWKYLIEPFDTEPNGKRKKDENGKGIRIQRQKHHLRLVTIIFGAIRIRMSDLASRSTLDRILSDVAQMAEKHHQDMTALGRGRHMRGMTRRGAIEIDLCRDLGKHVTQTLAGMGVDTSPLTPDERVLVVHSHMIVEASQVAAPTDLRGKIWARNLRAVLRSNWPAPRQMQVKGLYAHQTVREAITRIASYVGKQAMAYSSGGYGDEPTKYVHRFEPQWMWFVRQAYDRIECDMRSKR